MSDCESVASSSNSSSAFSVDFESTDSGEDEQNGVIGCYDYVYVYLTHLQKARQFFHLQS